MFTTTRGSASNATTGVAYSNGFVAAFAVNSTGYLTGERPVSMFEAPITLGTAGGIRVLPFDDASNPSITDYMYLSDNSQGVMYVLGWSQSNATFSIITSLKYPNGQTPFEAVWLD